MLALFLEGLMIGFAIAAPVGPINVLCVRRTLAQGPLAGLFSGIGAALADTIYGSIAAFGFAFVAAWLIDEQAWLRLAGGIFLIVLGIRSFLVHPERERSAPDPTSLLRDLTSTFFLTLTNPITILSFLAVFSAMGIEADELVNSDDFLLLTGVFLGSIAWWVLLTGSVTLCRHRFTVQGMVWANRISGIIIICFGAAALISGIGIFWQR